MNEFPNISLLVTHYNRSKSLENLLKTFQELNCVFGAIVVSDDGSKPEHLEYVRNLRKRYPFQLIETPVNRGLANNINKGQDAITTPFTLYVQEDFEPTSIFPGHLKDSLVFMEKDKALDIIRYYAYLRFPYLKYYDKGFSEMYIQPFASNYKKVYSYSDHPHLRRSTFFQKFGRYVEGINMERTEYRMCISFIQNKGKGLFFNEYKKLFIQKNSTEEPSTVPRNNWRYSSNIFIGLIRDVYRQFKYNYDILFFRPTHKT